MYTFQVTMEFNKVQDNFISFGVHQLEPVNVDLSVTVTSPAMKVMVLIMITKSLYMIIY